MDHISRETEKVDHIISHGVCSIVGSTFLFCFAGGVGKVKLNETFST